MLEQQVIQFQVIKHKIQQIERRLIRPMVNKITPLIGGTHLPIGLNDNNFGILEAKVPATNKGTTWPIAKLPRKNQGRLRHRR